MTKYQVQIDDLVRDANETETAAIEAAKAADEAQEQDDTARAAARQSALEKLAALGLTAGETAALFG